MSSNADFLSDWEKSQGAENLYKGALHGYEKACEFEPVELMLRIGCRRMEHGARVDVGHGQQSRRSVLRPRQDGGGGGDVVAGAARVREAVMGPASPCGICETVLVIFAPTTNSLS
jgi:hypothetical protein